jgi:asparagine synthase (glutamine-hydrolysing)
MSGIVGIYQLDGSPVDLSLLRRMTEAMRLRGPDAQITWADGVIGMGHALLETTDEGIKPQPGSLNDTFVITADARIDDRRRLVKTLGKTGPAIDKNTTDWELILQAYQKWGTDCVRHLMGDFAFAIWDKPRRRVFCARDHFGIKPLYYAFTGKAFLFGNSIECLQFHPEVTDRPCERAIADYLLFGYSVHPDMSAYEDIQRLPPAHTLLISTDGNIRRTRYWQLPFVKTIRYKNPRDYVGRFQELMNTAVADRLRIPNVGVLMSGGLDSTTVAATAHTQLKERYGTFDIRAFTFTYEWLIPDTEGKYAALAANALGIPVHLIQLDDSEDKAGWGKWQSSGDLRVGLTGQGGDAVLHPAVLPLTGHRQFARMCSLTLAAVKYWAAHRRLPAVGLRTHIRRRLGHKRNSRDAIYPPWFSNDFQNRLKLPARWAERHRRPTAMDTMRPVACRALQSPVWEGLFEAYDPGCSNRPVELRHPFFDIRLVSYCLALPPIPWCVDKEILRQANRNRLPKSVRQRPKSPLSGFPEYEELVRRNGKRLKSVLAVHGLDQFINVDTFITLAKNPQKLRPGEYYLISRPLALAGWLKQRSSSAG